MTSDNKKIQIRIYDDGRIEAETLGIKGKQCLKYIDIVEKLTNATTVKSKFTEDYKDGNVYLSSNTSSEMKAESTASKPKKPGTNKRHKSNISEELNVENQN